MRYLLVIFMVVISYVPSEAGYFFSYPRDGRFKMLPTHDDPWYYIDFQNWEITSPDKWQHYMSNYFAAKVLTERIGFWETASLLTTINALKEVEDGYREGASMRDFLVGSLGMLAGSLDPNLICEYDNSGIEIKYYFEF